MEPTTSPEQINSASGLRTRLPLQAVFVEVISIILGVVLALSVNEWRETNAQKQRAEAALTQIMEEVQSNNEFVSLVHANNQETLAHLHEPDEPGTDNERQFIPGIQVTSTAWETANSIGVFNRLDYKQILTLSKLYSIQEIYRSFGFGLIQALMNGTSVAAANGHSWDESEAIKKFESSLQLLVDMESALLERYSEILAEKIG